MSNTVPAYIAKLVTPQPTQAKSRKVRGLDLERTWLPFFHGTNVMGVTSVASDELGAPVRVAREKDGTVKVSSTTGKPIRRIAKGLGDSIRVVMSNFEAGLQEQAADVKRAHPEEYAASRQAAEEAGQPIIERDNEDVAALLESAEPVRIAA